MWWMGWLRAICSFLHLLFCLFVLRVCLKAIPKILHWVWTCFCSEATHKIEDAVYLKSKCFLLKTTYSLLATCILPQSLFNPPPHLSVWNIAPFECSVFQHHWFTKGMTTSPSHKVTEYAKYDLIDLGKCNSYSKQPRRTSIKKEGWKIGPVILTRIFLVFFFFVCWQNYLSER